MMFAGVALALVSWAGGLWMGIVFTDYKLEAMKHTHKKEMDEIFDEVKRLRAQNALLIGKE